MADEFDKECYKHKTDRDPIDFDFAAQFNAGDNVNAGAIVVTLPTNVTEDTSLRIVSGQLVQCAFVLASATAGSAYIVAVQGVSVAGHKHTLKVKINVIE
jgi:hypothetical protein